MIAFSMALENRKNMLSYNRSMPNTKDQNIRGFTLSISMAGRARFESTASFLAQSKMAEIEAANPESVVSDSGDFGDDFPDYSWRVYVTETEIEVLRKIEVKVVNERMTSNNSFRLVLYRLVVY
jgi:hypothetical protein